jgi:hypothetical protein
MKFCKSKSDPQSLYLYTESKYFNIDWLYIIASISEDTMRKFFANSIQYSYRGLILNFIKEPTGSRHFSIRTRVTCYGIELFVIESFAFSKSVAFKPNEIRIRVSNSIFYTKYLIFILKALFSKQMLCTSQYRISELHIAFDSCNEIYNMIDSMVTKQGDYTLSYLPTNDKGLGRKLQGQVFNIETRSFLGYTIGSKNSGLWLSCYNKASELRQSEKLYILQYWKKNNIEFNPEKFYRFEIRMDIKELRQYIDITTLESLNHETICNLYQTIFNERLQFKAQKRIEYSMKLMIANSKTLQKNKLDPHQSDRIYKQYFGYWVAQYYKFSLNPIDATGETSNIDYVFEQCRLMATFLVNFKVYNILFIKKKFENVTKEYPIKKLRKQIQNIKNMIESLEVSTQLNHFDNQ